jgi:hypothetical protein
MVSHESINKPHRRYYLGRISRRWDSKLFVMELNNIIYLTLLQEYCGAFAQSKNCVDDDGNDCFPDNA